MLNFCCSHDITPASETGFCLLFCLCCHCSWLQGWCEPVFCSWELPIFSVNDHIVYIRLCGPYSALQPFSKTTFNKRFFCETHPAVCVQDSYLSLDSGIMPGGAQGITCGERGPTWSATCKASVLTAVLLLWP